MSKNIKDNDTKNGVNDNNFIKGSAEIDLNSSISGTFKIYSDVKIKYNSVIINAEIGRGSEVVSSYIEDSKVGENCKIGPYAHLRPNSVILDGAKIGNFVEIKNSIIGKNTKVNHLAYIGDAEVGENCNIGCGVIFCNYNGKTKNKIKIGNNCFIGSNCNLIAPLNIADGTYICAGTTVVNDTNKNDFVIGRPYAIVKPNRATKYFSKE